jgi:hypothetical protein
VPKGYDLDRMKKRSRRSAGHLAVCARPTLPVLVGALSVLAYGFQDPGVAGLLAQRDDAIAQVQRIVNQPVPAYPLAEGDAGLYRPGWFHEGAARPNFLTVDVRASQTFPYDQWEYVTSDVTPGLMFRGRDLEFNPMTKYFYTDRSRPKKRLAPEEMDEINRLYRIIGSREQGIAARQAVLVAAPVPAEAGESAASPRRLVLYAAGGVLLLMLLAARRHASRSQQ